jgi:pimeloyl-ACP methyl ester carboxylesterase
VEFVTVRNGAIELNVAVSGSGPLIVCVHGFPELWYSWRHQVAYFAARGFRVAALDVRGYGRSSKPTEIAAYTLRHLASDVVAVIGQLGDGPAVLFGHDWGAPIVWHTALLHPDRIRAVAGLSVPFRPRGPAPFIDMVRAIYSKRATRKRSWNRTSRLRCARCILPCPARHPKTHGSRRSRPRQGCSMDSSIPSLFPGWMSESDLAVYVDAFRAGGFRGPLNRYRAQTLDFDDLAELSGRGISQPSAFIAGERDPVRAFIPGMDLYADPGVACSDFRGSTIIPGIGHWVQQEARDETNAALEAFVRGL